MGILLGQLLLMVMVMLRFSHQGKSQAICAVEGALLVCAILSFFFL